MELRHLRYFVVVAEELHFGKAAVRLSLAQPPLSQQIRQLESELGVELLRRTTRHVSLTEAGRLFLADARRILNYVEQATRSARRAQKGELGSLVIAFISSSSHDVMPMLLRDYRQLYPEVEITLNELETSFEGIAALKSASVHASIVRPPILDESLCCEVIGREPFLVALPQGHRFAERNTLKLEELSNEPFIVFKRHAGITLYDGIISECQKVGFSPRVVQELSGITSILCLVAAGVGVSILPASAAHKHTAGVIYRPLSANLLAELAVVWRKDDQSPALENLLSVARKIGPITRADLPNFNESSGKTAV